MFGICSFSENNDFSQKTIEKYINSKKSNMPNVAGYKGDTQKTYRKEPKTANVKHCKWLWKTFDDTD